MPDLNGAAVQARVERVAALGQAQRDSLLFALCGAGGQLVDKAYADLVHAGWAGPPELRGRGRGRHRKAS